MSYLNSDVEALAARLGWTVRVNAENHSELIVGDYARGFLIMNLGQEIQLAQRPIRGTPSLKLRTNDLEAAQQYLVFQIARLLRFREGRVDVAFPSEPSNVREPFQLRSTPFECVLNWGNAWIDFGVGNEFAAAQFAQYARSSTSEVAQVLLAA